MECRYHVRHSGGVSHAREDGPLVPTDLGGGPPQVRAARGELWCSWSTAPNRAGLWQQQATVELSNIGSAGFARSVGLTERLAIVCAPLSLQRVHIRSTAIRARPRTCIKGKSHS